MTLRLQRRLRYSAMAAVASHAVPRLLATGGFLMALLAGAGSTGVRAQPSAATSPSRLESPVRSAGPDTAARQGVLAQAAPARQPQPGLSAPVGAAPPEAAPAQASPPDPADTPVRLAVPLLASVQEGASWLLSVDLPVPLTGTLADAVARGIPLHYQAQFEVWRPRWYWRDELVVERELGWRLSYHALTRQYRLSQEGLIQTFENLEEALRALSRVRDWHVFDAATLAPGTEYEARVRMQLDTSQLPKPFQVSGMTNRDWNPQAEWKHFTFTMPTATTAR